MFNIGPVTFHLYGLLIGLGVLAGGWQASKYNKKIWEVLPWVLGCGLAGARLYHVIDQWDYYWLHPGQIVMLWRGGMGIFGGILGGLVGLWWQAKTWKNWLKLADAGAVGLALGQVIGRWGNYFNQELYGKPTSLPWAIYIKPENRLIEVINYDYFHPLFLYESLWCLIIFIILIKAINRYKYKIGSGQVLVLYLGLYGLGRFFLEFLRLESWRVQGVSVAQLISLGLVMAAGWKWAQMSKR
ncbi:MAG: prolipoprotein diacylglyceryl transferase [Patescibacteria group bacterium]